MQKYFVLTFFFLSILSANLKAEESGSSLAWQKWEDGLFEKAKSENRFVILDLEAVWCHWCHVMEETTYQDPKVKELIQAKYIPVRVDQDANPDISHRYEDYGWPATVVFAPDGSEIVKRRGYIPPGPMASLLQAIIDDPAPGPSITQGEEIRPAENAFLAPDQAEEIQAEHLDLYDKEFGGWGSIFKLIDADHMEYAMLKAAAGDKEEEGFALKTFDQALNLLDPVWGGFYQYSDQRDWKSPHFEKIMIIQTDYMRLYAMAWLIWQKPEYLNAAKAVADYAKNFMTSEKGAFYTSQDADVSPEFLGTEFYALTDSARRESGKMPRIDQHIYSRENGWMISSLAALYAATGEPSYLNQAVAATNWIAANRAIEGGGFRHDETDRNGPYLGDTLAMGRAFLALYTVTADRSWFEKSKLAADFILASFEDKDSAGFITAPVPKDAVGVMKKPVKKLDENTGAVHFMNLLFHYTGDAQYKKAAESAMRYLASPAIIQNKNFVAGILLADRALANAPVHITVVGSKQDAKAKELFLTAIRYPDFYKRTEWWDKTEGAMSNPDVKYPELSKPAAFACSSGRCSFPVFESEKLMETVKKFKT